jgi:heterodisulfide reductase subunit C
MSLLKQAATIEDVKTFRPGKRFYGSFLESVRRHGRVREMEMMNLYFIAMKNPLLPLKYAGLGLKLIKKGKVAIQLPTKKPASLDRIFKKTKELETGS